MVRLGIICILALGLAAAFSLAEENLDLKEVLPEAASFTPVKKGAEVLYYKAADKDGRLIGAVFEAKAKSYSEIDTLVGMLKDGTLTAIKVLAQHETPGIGSRVANQEFTDRFRNIKDISHVQAISGATVSSQAVIDAVKKKAAEIKALLKE
ncbi:MAG: FMN-binding protein [Candidatus Omnitrophica bacterium]|nr:FMN-binding protein [Candidatus Omnitrophota bacterium]